MSVAQTMIETAKTALKIKERINIFNEKISKTESEPIKKFMGEMLYGIQASKDVKLSNISRHLNEKSN
jgi:hypothetical protein